MGFLYPAMLGIAGAAIALPLLIHVLTRPRPVRFPLSTIRFVREAVAQKKSRHRLRDVLILFLRMVAIGLLGWAFARPLFQDRPWQDSDTAANVRRVVLLDTSQSMAANLSGVGRFELARARATRFLKPRSGLMANLVLVGAQPRAVFDRLSSSFPVLNEALDKSLANAERANIQPAINEAARLLSADAPPDAVLELVVISDFQRTNWATADFSALPAATRIQLESVAEAETPDNLAVESVRFQGRLTRGTESIVEVVVENFSRTARNVRCEVTFGNNAVTVTGSCPPLVRTTLTHPVNVSDEGWIQGVAKLLEHSDALPGDDACPFVGRVQSVSTFGIVTREPPSRIPSASWFIERAIAPYTGAEASRQPRIERMNPSRMSAQSVGECQLLVLVKPGKLEPDQINLLASLLRRGRAILYVTSELVDANNFRQLVDVLGQELQPPVELLPNQREAVRNGFAISDVQSGLRPFSVFGDSLAVLLASVRISGGLVTRRVPNSLDDDLLATLSDRSTLLFVNSVGAGNLGVLNADLSDSNLPRQQAFVPLMAELTDLLLPENDSQATAFCGEPLTRLLPPEASGLSGLSVSHRSTDSVLSGGDVKNSDAGQLRESGDGVLWQWTEARVPGIATIANGEQAVFSLALKSPPEESDLRSLDENVLTERLAGGRETSFRQSSRPMSSRDDSWIWFAASCVVALIGEIVALRFFRM